MPLLINKVYFRFVGIPFSNLQPTSIAQSSSATLAPTLAKSDKMFFQNVTPIASSSLTIMNREHVFAPFPCVLGEGLGLGVSSQRTLTITPVFNCELATDNCQLSLAQKPTFAIAAFAAFAAYFAQTVSKIGNTLLYRLATGD